MVYAGFHASFSLSDVIRYAPPEVRDTVCTDRKIGKKFVSRGC